MKERSELERRAAALRARQKGRDLAADLRRLLRVVAPTHIAYGTEAASLVADFRASYDAIESVPSLLVSEAWESDDRETIADSLHRLAGYLGGRATWLLLPAGDPIAVAVSSDDVLDNPFDFSALDIYQLRMLDGELSAGLWLLRHEHHSPGNVAYSWELEVWGEPWISAATRAFREVR
jgi:hypothetical protein